MDENLVVGNIVFNCPPYQDLVEQHSKPVTLKQKIKYIEDQIQTLQEQIKFKKKQLKDLRKSCKHENLKKSDFDTAECKDARKRRYKDTGY